MARPFNYKVNGDSSSSYNTFVNDTTASEETETIDNQNSIESTDRKRGCFSSVFCRLCCFGISDCEEETDDIQCALVNYVQVSGSNFIGSFVVYYLVIIIKVNQEDCGFKIYFWLK